MIEYTVKVTNNGSKFWYLNGKPHREDGPAIEWADGSKFWYLNGKLHREDGPAIKRADGSREWRLNDERHREDGPAVECADGSREWWLNGECLTEYEWKKALSPVRELTEAEISELLGYNVKVIRG